MKTLIVLSVMTLFISAENIKLSSKPISPNAVTMSELMTLEDEEGFYDRVASAISDNGNYLVLDQGNKLVHIFDPDGKRIKSFGKEGTGPGELSRPRWIDAVKDRVLVFDRGKTIIFKDDGTFIAEVSERWSRPTIVDGQIVFTFWDRPQVKFIKKVYDLNGKLVKSIPNPKFSKEAAERGFQFNSERFTEMMTRPRGQREYGNGSVRFYPGNYKFEILDANGKPKYVVTRDFDRVKEDKEEVMRRMNRWNRGGQMTEEQKRRRAQIMAQREQITGGYENDIQGILGVTDGYLFLRTATTTPFEIRIDVISPDLKYLAQLGFKDEKNEILSARVSDKKLLVNMTNEEDGPFVKVFNLNMK